MKHYDHVPRELVVRFLDMLRRRLGDKPLREQRSRATILRPDEFPDQICEGANFAEFEHILADMLLRLPEERANRAVTTIFLMLCADASNSEFEFDHLINYNRHKMWSRYRVHCNQNPKFSGHQTAMVFMPVSDDMELTPLRLDYGFEMKYGEHSVTVDVKDNDYESFIHTAKFIKSERGIYLRRP